MYSFKLTFFFYNQMLEANNKNKQIESDTTERNEMKYR